jgi:cephalosporin hydroxylase
VSGYEVRPLPPSVDATLTTGDMREYWMARAAQHTDDSYAGVRLSKMPEDLRTYEHLLWNDAADTVVEIGTQAGGSALWFRDRLLAMARYGRIERPPRVISVDVTQDWAKDALAAADPGYEEHITLVEADVRDPATARQVARIVGDDARCFVVEDSAHEYETTRAALDHFARFVHPGGYFVVEDGCVDVEELRMAEDWPRGVHPALHDWLQTPAGREFEVRRDLELYGLSCHPQGFLQRR